MKPHPLLSLVVILFVGLFISHLQVSAQPTGGPTVFIPETPEEAPDPGEGGGGGSGGSGGSGTEHIALNLSGYAWSGVGWISFGNGDYNSATYGVYLGMPTSGSPSQQLRYLGNQAGTGPGYAWSPNIGWIKFNQNFNDLFADGETGFPTADSSWGARLQVGTRQFSGWARACAVFVSGCGGVLRPESDRGGWDGWIKMGGQVVDGGSPIGSYTSSVDNGTTPTRFTADSYSWGGDVVGWIKWCSSVGEPSYCVHFGGLGASCSSTPPQFVFDSEGDHGVIWRVDTTNVSGGGGPYTYEWEVDGVEGGPSVTNSLYYDVSATYSCPSDHNQPKSAAFTVTGESGASASCSIQQTITCDVPGSGAPGSLGDPSTSIIRIAGQPLASPAISSVVSFSNEGDQSGEQDNGITVKIIGTSSLVDTSQSLGADFSSFVRCRMSDTPINDPAQVDLDEFGSCDQNSFIDLDGGVNAFFNIVVDNNPPPGLNQNSPYQIEIEGTAIACPKEQDCLPVIKSFLFDYAVGSVTPI